MLKVLAPLFEQDCSMACSLLCSIAFCRRVHLDKGWQPLHSTPNSLVKRNGFVMFGVKISRQYDWLVGDFCFNGLSFGSHHQPVEGRMCFS